MTATPCCDDGASLVAPEDTSDEHATLDDGYEPPPLAAGAATTPAPFAEISDGDLAARVRTDIGALGAMSIGRTHGGVLVAGMRIPKGASWEVGHPALAWGTKETMDQGPRPGERRGPRRRRASSSA